MKPRRGTGPPVFAVSAGTIASSMGSASVAPIPRRNVRRGSAFLVMNMNSPAAQCLREHVTRRAHYGSVLGLVLDSHLKGHAAHHAGHQRLERVVAAGRAMH